MKTTASLALAACVGALVGCDSGNKPTANATPAFQVVADVKGGTVDGTARYNWDTGLKRIIISFSYYDNDNNKLGTTSDIIGSLSPGETWRFKAHTFDRDATRFRFDGIQCSYGGLQSDFTWLQDELQVQMRAKAEAAYADQQKREAMGREWRAREKAKARAAEEDQARKSTRQLAEAKFRGVKLRAESGSGEAMAELSEMYRAGQGTAVDEAAAEMWKLKAEAVKKIEAPTK